MSASPVRACWATNPRKIDSGKPRRRQVDEQLRVRLVVPVPRLAHLGLQVGEHFDAHVRRPAHAYRWWVRGWEICRSYQNCASRRDSQGHGSQAAQAGLTQPILVFPSGVLSSAGQWAAIRRARAPVSTCMSPLLPGKSGRACWSRVPPARRQTAASGAGGPFGTDSQPPETSWSRLRSGAGRYHGDTPRASPDHAPARPTRTEGKQERG